MTVPVDPYARARLEDQSVPTIAAALVLVAAILVAVYGRAAGWGEIDSVETFVLIFSSIVVDALPFVLLGALVSGAIAVYVPNRSSSGSDGCRSLCRFQVRRWEAWRSPSASHSAGSEPRNLADGKCLPRRHTRGLKLSIAQTICFPICL